MTDVRGRLLPALVVVVAAVAGASSISSCSANAGEPGTAAPMKPAHSAQPGESRGTEPTAPEGARPTSVQDDATGTGLAALRPCNLLTPAERSIAGLTVLGSEKSIGSARACDWTEPGVFGLTITFDERTSLSEVEVDRGTGEQREIDGRAALRIADEQADDGTCAVLLAAAPSGGSPSGTVHVDVSNTSFTDTEQACDRADTVAGLIAPKLP